MITPIIGHGIVHADFDLTKRYGGGYGHWDYIYSDNNNWRLSTYDNKYNKIDLTVNNLTDNELDKMIEKYHVGGFNKISEELYRFGIWKPASIRDLSENEEASDIIIGHGLLWDTWDPEEFDIEIVKCLNKAYIAAYRESPTPETDSRIRAAIETIQSNGTIEYDELDIYAYSFIPPTGILTDSEIDLLKISDFRFDHKDESYYYYSFTIHNSKVHDPTEVHETFWNV